MPQILQSPSHRRADIQKTYASVDAAFDFGERKSTTPRALYTRQVLDSASCDWLLQQSQKLKFTKKIGARQNSDSEPSQWEQAGIPHDGAMMAFIHQSLTRDIYAAAASYGVSAPKFIELAKIVRYRAGGYANWHIDTEADARRSLALTLVLSDDYSGGDLVFGEPNGEWQCAPRDKGVAVIFPSDAAHRLTPITGGIFTALAWHLYR